MCECKSYNKPQDWQYNDEVVLDTPEGYERDTVCVDACIAHVIKHLWANGVVTQNCCCGHNKEAPSIVLDNNVSYVFARMNVTDLIKEVDKRHFNLLAWRLEKLNKHK